MSEFKDSILKQYPHKIELHCHSENVSRCSHISIEEMVRVYCENGYSGLVITNHFHPWLSKTDEDYQSQVNAYINEYKKLFELGEENGLRVYLGMEIRLPENDNDYLVYGIDEAFVRSIPRQTATLGEFVSFAKNESNLILQAHPFRQNMELMPHELLDGIEVYNMHPNHNSRVGFAARYAEMKGGVSTCGTDFHHPNQGALSALLTRQLPEDSFDLVNYIKNEPVYKIGNSVVMF